MTATFSDISMRYAYEKESEKQLPSILDTAPLDILILKTLNANTGRTSHSMLQYMVQMLMAHSMTR